jgi:hypothetical protein
MEKERKRKGIEGNKELLHNSGGHYIEIPNMEFPGKGTFLSVSHEITGVIIIQTMMAKNATLVGTGSTVGAGLLANEGPKDIPFRFGDSVVLFMDVGTVRTRTATGCEIIETA